MVVVGVHNVVVFSTQKRGHILAVVPMDITSKVNKDVKVSTRILRRAIEAGIDDA